MEDFVVLAVIRVAAHYAKKTKVLQAHLAALTIVQSNLSTTTPKAHASIKQNHTFNEYCCNVCLAFGVPPVHRTPGVRTL